MAKPTDIPRSAFPAPRLIEPAMLAWFAANARDLPWRRTRDPYAIWVSEIMLQQTQVKTVIPYWERWLRELPTIESLANAKPEKIHKLWEGLGYYTRVRNMQKAAQQIVAEHGGRFPEHFDAILALPGIGRYTAGAIASIAFDQPAPILDGNVIRVLARLHGIAEDPQEKQTNARLWQLAGELVTHAATIPQAGSKFPPCSALNQSLMELGALICTPRSPNCAACPVAKHCTALRENRVNELPRPKQRAAVTARRFLVFIIERNDKFLVQQRAEGVVNAHLWEFPNVEAETKAAAGLTATKFLGTKPAGLEKLCAVKHSITRYRMTAEAYRVSLGDARPKLPGVWRTLAQLHKLPFTSAHRQIATKLEKSSPAP
jgi:A/G-specific adenine glycosylase